MTRKRWNTFGIVAVCTCYFLISCSTPDSHDPLSEKLAATDKGNDVVVDLHELYGGDRFAVVCNNARPATIANHLNIDEAQVPDAADHPVMVFVDDAGAHPIDVSAQLVDLCPEKLQIGYELDRIVDFQWDKTNGRWELAHARAIAWP